MVMSIRWLKSRFHQNHTLTILANKKWLILVDVWIDSNAGTKENKFFLEQHPTKKPELFGFFCALRIQQISDRYLNCFNSALLKC